MLDLGKCRQIMGSHADGLDDKAVKEIRDALYLIAHAAFDNWIKGNCSIAAEAENSGSIATGQ
jgi:hypothetical protein